jgi:hypothetical protein
MTVVQYSHLRNRLPLELIAQKESPDTRPPVPKRLNHPRGNTKNFAIFQSAQKILKTPKMIIIKS